MSPVRIWFNRNYATSVHLLRLIRENPDGTEVELFGSHVDPSSPMLAACDRVLPEPDVFLPGFVDEVLDLCRRNRIQVFVPVAGQLEIARRRDEFDAVGTALICPPSSAIDALSDKAAVYEAVQGFRATGRGVRVDDLVPEWRKVTNLREFDAACADLAHTWTQTTPLVIKPVSGTGADGVRFLTRSAPKMSELLGPATLFADVGIVRAVLAEAGVWPPMMVMPYLSSPETSVDILARHGAVLCAVPRTKLGRTRLIGGDAFLPRAASELVARFGLDGLLNVQFRVLDGRPVLLEINTRPSGGLYQSALAGVNLPWAAIRVALGLPDDLPAVQLGATYVTVSSTVLVNAEAE